MIRRAIRARPEALLTVKRAIPATFFTKASVCKPAPMAIGAMRSRSNANLVRSSASPASALLLINVSPATGSSATF